VRRCDIVTFTNGRITLATDLIFKVVVLSEHGWIPFSSLTKSEKKMVQDLLDYNPTCPDAIKTVVYGPVEEAAA